MFEYIKILLQEAWSKDYWMDRWDTFLALVRDPGGFYAEAGKKDWDRNAYLFGLSVGFLQVFIFAFTFSGIIGLFTRTGGLLLLFLSLGFGLAAWLAGAFLLYYGAAWIFGLALKLVAKKNETAKIRPILFTIAPSSIFSIVPGLGGLLTLLAFVVLMVIAYEKALKAERGQAVVSSVLGLVFTAVASWILALALGIIFGAGFSGPGLASSRVVVRDISTKLPDSWGAFEFLHHRSDEQKMADAVKVIHDEILDDEGGDMDHEEYADALLISLYGDPDIVPMDAYRLAIQQVLKDAAAAPYANRALYEQIFFDQKIDSYYDKGKGPATVTVAAVEDRRKQATAVNQSLQRLQAVLRAYGH